MDDKKSTRFSLDELARQLAESVPQNLKVLGQDLERNFKTLLQSGIERMELVSREEFDVQRAVLERTRAKLEAMEGAARRPRESRSRPHVAAGRRAGRGPAVGLARTLSRGQSRARRLSRHGRGALRRRPARVRRHGLAGRRRPREQGPRARRADHLAATPFPRAASPCTWARPTFRRPAAGSISRSRSACCSRSKRRPGPSPATEFLGELALNGDLRPINGALPAVLAAQQAGHALVLPAANAAEAALVADAEVYVAPHLNEVVRHLSRRRAAAARRAAHGRPGGRQRARSRRRARPGVRETRARRRGRRLAQPADDRPAGQRQEHARRAA